MATTITKLFPTGILQSSVEFDEVTYSSVKVGPAGVYAAQFDEVTQSPIKNLLTYSNQMQAGGWTRSGTLADNADIAPDGTNTALLETQVTGGDNLIYSNGVPGNTSTTYTASVYFKQGTKPTVGLYVDDAGFGGARWLSVYTWASGTLTNSIGGLNGGAGATLPTSTVSPAPNGWIRMTMTFRPIDVGNMILMVNRDLQPTGGTTYIWGAQLEANTSVTPYQGIGASGVIVTPDFAERRTSTGTYIVSGYFDEYTIPNSIILEYLVLAGGGGGGEGGGGGGGLLTGTAFSVTRGTAYTVTVGAGGIGNGLVTAPNGDNSVFSSLTAIGGGGGAGPNGAAGGSGGGASRGGVLGGAATSGQGNAGGGGSNGASPYASGGGGGAGAAGGTGSGSVSGSGGAGSTSTITGSSLIYGGGGGGAGYNPQGNTTAGTGGIGGGGNGVSSDTNGGPGTANLGGGGGGTASDWASSVGGTGGSGVVILAYPNTYGDLASVSAGLTCNGSAGNSVSDQVSRSGYKIYKFTAGTGTISW